MDKNVSLPTQLREIFWAIYYRACPAFRHSWFSHLHGSCSFFRWNIFVWACRNKEPHSSGILLCRVVVVEYEKWLFFFFDFFCCQSQCQISLTVVFSFLSLSLSHSHSVTLPFSLLLPQAELLAAVFFSSQTDASLTHFKASWDKNFFQNGENYVNRLLATGSAYHTSIGASSDSIPVWDRLWVKRWLPTVSWNITQTEVG